jgi:hypothetical protein
MVYRLSTDWSIEELGFNSCNIQDIFLFPLVFKLVLGITPLPLLFVIGVLFLGVKWLGCEVDHSSI